MPFETAGQRFVRRVSPLVPGDVDFFGEPPMEIQHQQTIIITIKNLVFQSGSGKRSSGPIVVLVLTSAPAPIASDM